MGIEKIGVVGAGQMGNGIAHVAAQELLQGCMGLNCFLEVQELLRSSVPLGNLSGQLRDILAHGSQHHSGGV